MKIAFLTAGGIAPCLSASIGGLIKSYNSIFPTAELLGYLNGYKGLLTGQKITIPDSVKKNTKIFDRYGGSPIGNSRVKLTNIENCVQQGYINDGQVPLEVAAQQLIKDKVDNKHFTYAMLRFIAIPVLVFYLYTYDNFGACKYNLPFASLVITL